MRALVAALLAALVTVSAASPHVHSAADGDHDCPACVARGAEEAHSETPDVEPAGPVVPGMVPIAIEAPPAGAPLGAIPGQSPPA